MVNRLKKMTKKFIKSISLPQTLWTAGGLLLFGGGLLALNSQSENLVDIAGFLGFVMMSAGAFNVIIYCHKGKQIHGSQWLLADGLSTMLLALFPLINDMIQPVMIPFFFGAWELFSGVLKVIDSRELKKERIKCWQGFSLIGFIELLSGTASMVKTVDDLVGVNVVVAVILFVQSCGFIIKTFMYNDLIDNSFRKEKNIP